jgi:hypothetical protein
MTYRRLDTEALAMGLRPIQPTIEGLLIVLAAIIAGSLIVGTMTELPTKFLAADLMVFAFSYSTSIALALVLVVRYLRCSSKPRLRPSLATIMVVVVMACATIECPVVRRLSFYASCELNYLDDPAPSFSPGQLALYSRLRREQQRLILWPLEKVCPQ